MNAQLTAGKIRKSIQRFSDYSNDLIRSDVNNFEDRINVLLNFCSSDEVFSNIHRQLLSVPGADFAHWLAERQQTESGMAGRGQLHFPSDVEPRMALMYQLLLGIRDGRLGLNAFLISFFVTGSNKINDYIYAFNENITQPLVRELGYRLEELQEQLPAEETSLVSPALVQIVHHATNVIQQHATGQNISQHAKITNPEIAKLFNQLRETVQGLDASAEQRSEAMDIIASAEDAAATSNPRLAVIRALLGALPTTDTILSISASICSLLSQIV